MIWMKSRGRFRMRGTPAGVSYYCPTFAVLAYIGLTLGSCFGCGEVFIEGEADGSTDVRIESESCSLVDQSGCPAGFFCNTRFDESCCCLQVVCEPEPTTWLPERDECSVSLTPDRCGPGLFCADNEDLPPYFTCHRWCHTSEDCDSPDEVCGAMVHHYVMDGPCLGTEVLYPTKLCIFP